MPATVSDTVTTIVRLQNTSAEAAEASFAVAVNGKIYTSVVKVGPFETIELNLKSLAKGQIQDGVGNVLPSQFHGIVRIAPRKPGVLLASSVVFDETSGVQTVFSCPEPCQPNPSRIDILPEEISCLKGDYRAFLVLLTLSDGWQEDVTGSCIYNTDSNYVSRSGNVLLLTRFGNSEITATWVGEKCIARRYDSEGRCFCDGEIIVTLVDKSKIIVKDIFLLTCYGLPQESGFTGDLVTHCGLPDQHREDFLRRVRLNGSGQDRFGHWVSIDWNSDWRTSFETTCFTHNAPTTRSGTTPTEGRTVAVDPAVIPLGWNIYITNIGNRTAEDTGDAITGNHIDVFMGFIGSASTPPGWGNRNEVVWRVD